MASGTLGIIGFGNMGSAIINGLIDSHVYMPSDIHVFDIEPSKRDLAKSHGHFSHDTIGSLLEKTGTVIIAVKPKDIHGVLHEVAKGKELSLVISIAAGITTGKIEEMLKSAPLVRAMPNTPCMVRAGATVISRGKNAADSHVALAKKILGATGYVAELPESLMDAVTGLSGYPPACRQFPFSRRPLRTPCGHCQGSPCRNR